MKRSVVFAAIAVCAMFGAAQVQAAPAYMKYDGVKGESQKGKTRPSGGLNVAAGDVNGDGLRKGKKDDHKEWIPVESAQASRHGGGGTGKATNHDIKAPTEQTGLLVPAIQRARPN